MARTAVRLILVALWFSLLMAWYVEGSQGWTAAIVVGAASALVVGVVVDRWWALLVPATISVGLCIWAYDESRPEDEIHWLLVAAAVVACLGFVSVFLAVGTALGRARREARRPAPGTSAQTGTFKPTLPESPPAPAPDSP